MTSVKCFICYAHKDLEMVEQLHGVHLKALLHNPALEDMKIWRDRDIVPGDKWNDEIQRAIETSDVFVMLLSDHWFASDFIRTQEYPAIKNRTAHDGAVIVPILLSDCRWQRRFSAEQLAPLAGQNPKPIDTWQPPSSGYRVAADAIEAAILKLLDNPDRKAAQRQQLEGGYRWVVEPNHLAIDRMPDPSDAAAANDPVTRDWHNDLTAKAGNFSDWIRSNHNRLHSDWHILTGLAAKFAGAVVTDLGNNQRELLDAWRAYAALAKELERHAARQSQPDNGAPLDAEVALELGHMIRAAGLYLRQFPTIQAQESSTAVPVSDALAEEIRHLIFVVRERGLIDALDADAVTDGLTGHQSRTGLAAASFSLLSAHNLIVKMCSVLAIERIAAQGTTAAAALSDRIRTALREAAPRISTLRGSLPYDLRHAFDVSQTDAPLRPRPSPRDAFWSGGKPPTWAEDWGRDQYGPWVTFRVPGTDVTQRLRWCPPGTFLMGSPDSDKDAHSREKPQHQVTFANGFWMFDTAVTVALWSAVMRDDQREAADPRLPVTEVDWSQTQAFVTRLNAMLPGLNLSLPSEAAWEYACRAGTTTRYSFGDRITKRQVRFESGSPVPVASLPANQWGLHEMHGNVWEWCLDYYHGTYDAAPDDGSAWIDGDAPRAAADRVIRGGSWVDVARFVRAAFRFWYGPSFRDGHLGFRCARVHSESGAAGAATPAHPPRPAEAEPAGPSGSAGVAVSRRAARPDPGTEAFALDFARGVYRVETPPWATETGTDQFGRYAILRVPGTDVTQRLRWIEPGACLIGSPRDEVGRFTDEGPQTPVTFTDGFWMFDTPVTQALWQAVMGENPSRFQSPDRPVDTVSHTDAQAFLRGLNALIPALRLSLPSEAEWEYACRAGTTTATYRGDLGPGETKLAPVLDDIAWYVGNSHDGFDLANGYDVAEAIGKPKGSAKAGTRPVALKAPNDRGLYDMLGNVWEWCADEWHDSLDGLPLDGTARLGTGATSHVMRGGSWIAGPADVRAAYRSGDAASYSRHVVGFRCVRVQSDSEAKRRADGASEASGARPRRRPARRGA